MVYSLSFEDLLLFLFEAIHLKGNEYENINPSAVTDS